MNTPTIKALQTRYDGCHFRSRLEARWAVFFNHLRIPWQYEPQGYALPSGPYLPDFYLPTMNDGCWFEVKPPGDGERDPRHEELAQATGRSVYVYRGMPWPDFDPYYHDQAEGFGVDAYVYEPGFGVGWDCDHVFCICTDHGTITIQFEGRYRRGCRHCPEIDDSASDTGHPFLTAALQAARSARFERR